jgi:hypothetical protein
MRWELSEQDSEKMGPANARMMEMWPEIVAVQYEGEPEMIAANTTPQAAAHYLREIDGPIYEALGAPNGTDLVAMVYLTKAVTAMCAMDHASARRLLAAAVDELDHPERARAEMTRHRR